MTDCSGSEADSCPASPLSVSVVRNCKLGIRQDKDTTFDLKQQIQVQRQGHHSHHLLHQVHEQELQAGQGHHPAPSRPRRRGQPCEAAQEGEQIICGVMFSDS